MIILLLTHTCIGVENNDLARKHYQSSNHQDAPKDVIETEGRIEQLSSMKI